jgi:hypothetical protein
VGWPEYGLRGLTAGDVESWVAERFGASVASLWIAGQDPEEVAARGQIELPDGEGFPLPTLDPVFRPPGRAERNVTGPSISLVGTRTPSFTAAAELLRHRLERDARHERAVAYAVNGSYTALTADEAHVHVGFDALDHLRAEAVDSLYRVLGEVDDDPTDAEVERHVRQTNDRRNAPDYGAQTALHLATEALLGGDDDIELLEQRVLAVDARSIGDALREAMTSALLMTPKGVEVPNNRIYPLSDWSLTAVEGREFLSVGKTPGLVCVVVGEAGVTIEFGHKQLTVLSDACEALARWDDGTRLMVGRDGIALVVAPWDFEQGEQLTAAIDGLVEPGRWIPMGPGDGPPDTGGAGARKGRRVWKRRAR